jgi:mRNA-degrading endonuclease RelE of RelBE toxin-antitoxin system
MLCGRQGGIYRVLFETRDDEQTVYILLQSYVSVADRSRGVAG